MNVALEALTPAHYESAAVWLGDPAINQWMYAEWRERKVNSRLVALSAQNPRNRIWLIRAGGAPYGLCSISAMSELDRTGSVWYLRAPGQTHLPGAITQAVRRMTAVGFDTLGLRSVSASLIESNVASRRVLEGAGYRYAGCLREALAFQGGFVNRLFFDCLPADLRSV